MSVALSYMNQQPWSIVVAQPHPQGRDEASNNIMVQLLSWTSDNDDCRYNIICMFYKVFALAAGNELNTNLH